MIETELARVKEVVGVIDIDIQQTAGTGRTTAEAAETGDRELAATRFVGARDDIMNVGKGDNGNDGAKGGGCSWSGEPL